MDKIEVSLTDVKLFICGNGLYLLETPASTIKLREAKT